MVLYPTTAIFRAVHAVTDALRDFLCGHQLDPAQSVDMDAFEKIVGLPKWAAIEKKFPVDR